MTQSIVVDPAVSSNEEITQDTPESKIPDKYKGKSPEELIQILQNQESTIGRQANEVGQLRKLTDNVLDLARTSKFTPVNQQHEKPAPVTSEDLLSRPEETVTELVKRVADDRLSGIEKSNANLEAQLAVMDFARKYPDFEKTMADQEFQQWVQGSAYRSKLANAAATKGDFDAAGELFDLYAANKPEKAKEQPDPLEAARKASLTKKGGSSAAGVAKTSADGKKIYSRTELINERIHNPELYHEKYATEYHAAYKEGRVR